MASTSETEVEKEALRSRIEFLAKQYSQRELARRTDVPQQNINAYLVRGTRVPAFFLSRLVDRLGVNPSWLLSGEGTPMLADVAASNTQLTGDLLEVIQAMNSVAKMRLGALTGKDHLKTLRSLNEALRKYDELRTTINERCRPVYEKISKDLYTALRKPDLDQAEALVAAGDQISRLAHDDFLDSSYFMSKSTLAYYKGDFDEAISLQRRAIYSHFSTGTVPNGWFYQIGASVATSLAANMYVNESRNACDALLSLGKGSREKLTQYQLLTVIAGVLDVESGELDQGLSRILSSSTQQLPDHDCGWFYAALNRALYFRGSIALRDLAHQAMEPRHKVPLVVSAALWEQDSMLLDELPQSQGESTHEATEYEALLYLYGQTFSNAQRKRRGNKMTAIKKFETDASKIRAPENFAKLTLPVMKTLIALTIGAREEGTKLLEQADSNLEQHSPRLSAPLLFQAIHHRCVLEILPHNVSHAKKRVLRDKALTFFSGHRTRGYRIFESAT